MNKPVLPFFCCVLILCAGCQRPEDGNPSKFQRQANIEKYVQKAKNAGLLAGERQKPLPVTAPADVNMVSNDTRFLAPDFLPQALARNRHVLEKRLQETYSLDAQNHLSTLLEEFKEALSAAAKEAATPAQLAASVREVQARYARRLEAYAQAQAVQTRLRPSQQLLDEAKARLNRRCEDFFARMELYYGPAAAQACRPALEKAVQDYIFAMASAASAEDLSAKLADIVRQAAAQVKEIQLSAGDPLGVTPEEAITALRAAMITAHQTLETRIEALYGKEEVLQSRQAFNRLLEEGGKVLRESARLSAKKAALTRLNEEYIRSMLSLQQVWNTALEQPPAQRRPPDYLISSK